MFLSMGMCLHENTEKFNFIEFEDKNAILVYSRLA